MRGSASGWQSAPTRELRHGRGSRAKPGRRAERRRLEPVGDRRIQRRELRTAGARTQTRTHGDDSVADSGDVRARDGGDGGDHCDRLEAGTSRADPRSIARRVRADPPHLPGCPPGIFDGGRLVFAYNTVNNAAQPDAKRPSTRLWPISRLAARTMLSPSTSRPGQCRSAISPTTTTPCVVGQPQITTCLAVVLVTYDYSAATPIISALVGPITVTGEVRFPVEFNCVDGGGVDCPLGQRGGRREGVSSLAARILIIVAGGLVVIVSMVGLVIDGGQAWVRQRDTQNGADAVAKAGTIQIQHYLVGDTPRTTSMSPARWPMRQQRMASSSSLAEYTDFSGELLVRASRSALARATSVWASPRAHRACGRMPLRPLTPCSCRSSAWTN